MNQTGTKIAHVENFIRSATAPEISAGVMAANMPRKATMANVLPSPTSVMSFRKKESNVPMNLLPNGTWASE